MPCKRENFCQGRLCLLVACCSNLECHPSEQVEGPHGFFGQLQYDDLCPLAALHTRPCLMAASLNCQYCCRMYVHGPVSFRPCAIKHYWMGMLSDCLLAEPCVNANSSTTMRPEYHGQATPRPKLTVEGSHKAAQAISVELLFNAWHSPIAICLDRCDIQSKV